MTRSAQISEAAKNYCFLSNASQSEYDFFIQGAKWADANPIN